jgi:hypothetical protein
MVVDSSLKRRVKRYLLESRSVASAARLSYPAASEKNLLPNTYLTPTPIPPPLPSSNSTNYEPQTTSGGGGGGEEEEERTGLRGGVGGVWGKDLGVLGAAHDQGVTISAQR